MYKKFGWKSYELIIAVCIAIFVFALGIKNCTYVVNPVIKTQSLSYVYCTGIGVTFGKEYHFLSENGQVLDLTLDPITQKKLELNEDFIEGNYYLVTFESNSNTIIDVKFID